jgi:hypothetical protein
MLGTTLAQPPRAGQMTLAEHFIADNSIGRRWSTQPFPEELILRILHEFSDYEEYVGCYDSSESYRRSNMAPNCQYTKSAKIARQVCRLWKELVDLRSIDSTLTSFRLSFRGSCTTDLQENYASTLMSLRFGLESLRCVSLSVDERGLPTSELLMPCRLVSLTLYGVGYEEVLDLLTWCRKSLKVLSLESLPRRREGEGYHAYIARVDRELEAGSANADVYSISRSKILMESLKSIKTRRDESRYYIALFLAIDCPKLEAADIFYLEDMPGDG